ncbi:MAG: beta-ketoacyl synthase N-terminal-like domain-containing protein [Bacteroidales bacterium]|nr:beta-ketoacyl synthase N-terminal-like domain-containing protein [Bacteroidales bacterium]
MNIYIQAASQISTQEPLNEKWFDTPSYPDKILNESIDPDFKAYIPVMIARRMGNLLKRGIVTSVDALNKCSLNGDNLQAVITGTGLGCIENTEHFLNAVLDNEESCLQPTFFIQSTHNTISSQIALFIKCHGYNTTYSHRGTSFDSCLLDAFVQMKLGLISNALVGGHDEMTPSYFTLLQKVGYWKNTPLTDENFHAADTRGSISGNASLSMVMANMKVPYSLCQMRTVEMLYAPTMQEIKAKIDCMLEANGMKLADVDAVVMGLSGDKDNDNVYKNIMSEVTRDIPVMCYKHIFGESFCASAYGVYTAATAIAKKRVPSHLLYSSRKEILNPRNILVFNHFHNIDHSLILLSCPD